MSKVQPTKTHVLSDYELGKWMYRRCVAFEACTNDRMRDGWNVAENAAAWAIYDDSPEDAVRFSEAAFQSAAYSNEYSFNGVDYSEPAIQ